MSGQFQLFPPPSPRTKSGRNPFRNGSKTSNRKSQYSEGILKRFSNTEAVLLQIIEDTNNIQAPPKAHIGRETSPEKVPEPTQRLKPPLQSGPAGSQNNGNPRLSPAPSRHSSCSTLVENAGSSTVPSTSAPQEHSRPPKGSGYPPMRSISPPTYNDSLPSNQQNCPWAPGSPSTRHSRHRPERLVITPAPEIDTVLGPSTVPASAMYFGRDMLEPEEIRYPSRAELAGLWEVANGQRPEKLLGLFNLRMTRSESATFVFGDPQFPFYTMQTYSTNELSLARTDPSRLNRTVPVIMLSLEYRHRRLPPHDGLVTRFVSRMAAMLAMDQAHDLAMRHRLAPTDAVEVEENALKQAASQETCRLRWSSDRLLYELHHPSLSKQPAPAPRGLPDGTTAPATQATPIGKLHITVSTPSNDCESESKQAPAILVTNPAPPNAVDAACLAATSRTSTFPLTDSDEPLASLDFRTMTLSISPALILAAMPSLYAIDSVVAAILAVAVSDETTNPILAEMVLQEPAAGLSKPPRGAQPAARLFTGKLFATFAERDDAVAESRLMSQIKAGNIIKSSQSEPESTKGWARWFRSKATNQKKTTAKTQIVTEELDMEKYGRYGRGSSREGEKLPGTICVFLRLMFWALNVTVWGLTMAVKVLAWLLVNVTRCVTSEKF